MDIQFLTQLPSWFTSLLAFLLGLAVGSFVNVVISRVPRQMSIVRPGSHCPHCGAPVKARDNIPLLSYLLLRGKCRSCGAGISVRYPAVELLLGLFFLFIWQKDGLSWSLPLDWAFVSAMLALAGTDLEHRLLPDMITYPGFVVVVGLRGLVTNIPTWPWVTATGIRSLLLGAGMIAASGFVLLALERLDFHLIGRRLEPAEEEPPIPETASASYGIHLDRATLIIGFSFAGLFLVQALLRPSDTGRGLMTGEQVESVSGALAGAVMCAGILWGLRLVYFAIKRIEGAGFGDVKMMLMVGAYLGLPLSFLMVFLASLLGSVVGLLMMVWHRNRYVQLPYGVFIALAAVISLLWGASVVHWYSGFFSV